MFYISGTQLHSGGQAFWDLGVCHASNHDNSFSKQQRQQKPRHGGDEFSCLVLIFCNMIILRSLKPTSPLACWKAKWMVQLTWTNRNPGICVQHHSEPPSALTLQFSALTHSGVHMVTPIPCSSIFGRKTISMFTKDQPFTLQSWGF